MKTLEEIKAEIIASNPSRIYVLNGEQFEQSEEEFLDAVNKRAEMIFEQNQNLADSSAAKTALLERLGITEEEARLLLA
jgi:hypothetical protein